MPLSGKNISRLWRVVWRSSGGQVNTRYYTSRAWAQTKASALRGWGKEVTLEVSEVRFKAEPLEFEKLDDPPPAANYGVMAAALSQTHGLTWGEIAVSSARCVKKVRQDIAELETQGRVTVVRGGGRGLKTLIYLKS